MGIKHAKTNTNPPSDNPAFIDSDDWNAAHVSLLSGARVFMSVDQSIPSGNPPPKVVWGTSIFDTDAYFNAGGDATALHLPSTGIYLLSAQVSFDVEDVDGVRQAYIEPNLGTLDDNYPLVTQTAVQTDGTQLNLSGVMALSASDDIRLAVYQTSGSTITLTKAYTWLSVVRLGDLP